MLYTTEQVAHMSGVVSNTVLKCMHSGMIDGCQIRSTKTGRKQYFFNEAGDESTQAAPGREQRKDRDCSPAS